MVAVAYEKWPLTRDSKYSDLVWKLLVFWKTGRCGEVVACERCLQPLLLPQILKILAKVIQNRCIFTTKLKRYSEGFSIYVENFMKYSKVLFEFTERS